MEVKGDWAYVVIKLIMVGYILYTAVDIKSFTLALVGVVLLVISPSDYETK